MTDIIKGKQMVRMAKFRSKEGRVMAMLSDLKGSEELKFRLLQQRMMEAPTYLTSLYFKLRADGVLYRAERRIKREAKKKQKTKKRGGC